MRPDIEFLMVGTAQDVFGPTVQHLSDRELTVMVRAALRLGL
jgi:hypothetical protein